MTETGARVSNRRRSAAALAIRTTLFLFGVTTGRANGMSRGGNEAGAGTSEHLERLNARDLRFRLA